MGRSYFLKRELGELVTVSHANGPVSVEVVRLLKDERVLLCVRTEDEAKVSGFNPSVDAVKT